MRNITILKLKDGENPPSKAQIIAKGDMLVQLQTGDVIGSYSLDSVTRGDDGGDDTTHIKTYFDQINLKAINTTSDYDYLSILQDAVNYGVVADSIKVVGHSQTNLATNLYQGSTNIDSNLSGPLDKSIDEKFCGSAPGVTFATKIDGVLELGVDTKTTPVVITGEDDLSKVRATNKDEGAERIVKVHDNPANVKSIVDGMISDMQAVSRELASKPATLKPTVTSADGSKISIDATRFADDATIYIDADDYLAAIANADGVHIKKKPDQVIVFNFKKTATVSAIKEIVVDSGDGNGPQTTNTIWNDAADPQNDYADTIARHSLEYGKRHKFGKYEPGRRYVLTAPRKDPRLRSAELPADGLSVPVQSTLGFGGEFHFVYRDLNPNSKKNLSLKKSVDHAIPTDAQKFDFAVERIQRNGI